MTTDDLDGMRTKLKNHERRISQLEKHITSRTHALKREQSGKAQSIKEFMLEKNPNNDVLKTLVIAYYVEIRNKVTPFNLKDLEVVFREAKEPLPSNLSDKVAMNIRKGHMMVAGEKKDGFNAWTLTSTGERFVENGLKDAK